MDCLAVYTNYRTVHWQQKSLIYYLQRDSNIASPRQLTHLSPISQEILHTVLHSAHHVTILIPVSARRSSQKSIITLHSVRFALTLWHSVPDHFLTRKNLKTKYALDLISTYKHAKNANIKYFSLQWYIYFFTVPPKTIIPHNLLFVLLHHYYWIPWLDGIMSGERLDNNMNLTINIWLQCEQNFERKTGMSQQTQTSNRI